MRDKVLKWLAFKLQKQLTPYLPERIVYQDKIVYMPMISPPREAIKMCTHQIDKFYTRAEFNPHYSANDEPPYFRRIRLIKDLKAALLEKADDHFVIFQENPQPDKHTITIGVQLSLIKPE